MTATDRAEATAPARPPRRRLHPAVRWAIGVVVALVLLVAVDTGVRLFLQWRIATSVEESLPPGVTATVDARVHGVSTLWQLATGSFEHLELESTDLTVLGVTLAARVDGYGVTFGDGPLPALEVEQLAGELRIGQDALNRLVEVPGADGGVTLGDGTVAYSTTMSFLGLSVDVDLEASLVMQGDRLVVQATRIQLAGGPVDVDAADLLGDATIAVPICTADYLPVGIHLSGVDVSQAGVTVSITGNTIALDEATLGSRGTCR